MASVGGAAPTCAHFLQRKKRYCRMNVKAGKKYCGEHAVLEEATTSDPVVGACETGMRMPCPYDPQHSCYVSQLEKHLEKCNSRPKPMPEYIQPSANIQGENDGEEMKISLSDLTDKELLSVIDRTSEIHKKYVGDLPNAEGRHPAVEAALNSLKESRGSWRHVYQNSSIMHCMSQAGILTSGDSSTYVEFGSGRGQLSYVLGQAINLETDSLLMIDKSSPRHKHENRFKVDGQEHASIQRIRADIADVVLHQVPLVRSSSRLVGTGKHLCGAATDLALNCLHNAHKDSGLVKGVCIALCCHHRCTWRHYVGKAFFKEVDLDAKDFAVMRALTSWATCGSRAPAGSDQPEEHDGAAHEEALPGRYAALGLDAATRERIGRQCKQVIDRGRVSFISSWPLNARLVRYVQPDVSPENVLLIAS